MSILNVSFRRVGLAVAMTVGALAAPMSGAQACGGGGDDYIGTVCTFSFTFCPGNTLPADGRLLTISQNQALYALLGTKFGGDGRTTFALPDLRGRASVGVGTGPGLSSVVIGQQIGQPQVTLAVPLPQHTHSLSVRTPMEKPLRFPAPGWPTPSVRPASARSTPMPMYRPVPRRRAWRSMRKPLPRPACRVPR